MWLIYDNKSNLFLFLGLTINTLCSFLFLVYFVAVIALQVDFGWFTVWTKNTCRTCVVFTRRNIVLTRQHLCSNGA